MKKIQKLISSVILLSLIFSFTVFGQEETALLSDGQVVSVEVENSIDPRGVLIATRMISLTNNEDGTMTASAQLLAHVSLDYALIRIYIDEYNPDTDDWSTLDYKDTEFFAEDYTESYMSAPGMEFVLEGLTVGRYYRLRGSYVAKGIGRRESGDAATDGVKLTKIY